MKTKEGKMTRGMLLVCLAALLGLAGCANWSWYGPTTVDQDYGNSTRNNLAQTVLNPAAGSKEAVAPGLEPTAAANSLGQYEKGFKGEEKKPMEMKISY